jgi:hypothetical protein
MSRTLTIEQECREHWYGPSYGKGFGKSRWPSYAHMARLRRIYFRSC